MLNDVRYVIGCLQMNGKVTTSKGKQNCTLGKLLRMSNVAAGEEKQPKEEVSRARGRQKR